MEKPAVRPRPLLEAATSLKGLDAERADAVDEKTGKGKQEAGKGKSCMCVLIKWKFISQTYILCTRNVPI